MLEIDKILTVSTSHISSHSFNWLKHQCENPTCNIIAVCEYEYGFIIYINRDLYLKYTDADISSDIYKIINIAIKNNCAYLRFDNDGPIIPGIMTYENTYD